MILIDANLLIYAHNTEAARHAAARSWFEATLSNADTASMAWASILAFLRVTTNPRIIARALPPARAGAIVTGWLERPNVTVLDPTSRHWLILKGLLEAGQVRGPLATDAHLAALAIEHGATLCTTDRDFARFPGLKWTNPLES